MFAVCTAPGTITGRKCGMSWAQQNIWRDRTCFSDLALALLGYFDCFELVGLEKERIAAWRFGACPYREGMAKFWVLGIGFSHLRGMGDEILKDVGGRRSLRMTTMFVIT